MKPEKTKERCIHCGVIGARDWSDISNGALVCDDCPIHAYEVDSEWKYPDLLAETRIEGDVWVVTQAMESMNKYGNCYRSVAVNKRTSQIKEVSLYKNRDIAIKLHQRDVQFVIERRALRKRVYG